MSLPSVITGYSPLSKWFHWIIAMVVIAMLSFSFFLDDLPNPYQPSAYMIHKSLGLTVLFLVFLRLIWITKILEMTLTKLLICQKKG